MSSPAPSTPPQDVSLPFASMSVSLPAPPPLPREHQRKIPRKVAKRLKSIHFRVIDAKVSQGEYGSSELPSALSVENYTREVNSSLVEKDVAVIPFQEIKIHFKNYKAEDGGGDDDSSSSADLIVTATAEDGRTFFSRADLARAVCRQFKLIYSVPESGKRPGSPAQVGEGGGGGGEGAVSSSSASASSSSSPSRSGAGGARAREEDAAAAATAAAALAKYRVRRCEGGASDSVRSPSCVISENLLTTTTNHSFFFHSSSSSLADPRSDAQRPAAERSCVRPGD